MNGQCGKCDAECCRYFCFEIDEPDCYEEYDDIRWFLCHEDVTVHIDDGDWYISIANCCKMLDRAGRCVIYDDRPVICRKYDLDNCDYSRGDYGYDALFETPEDVETYARKVLGDSEFEKARAKARPKSTPTPKVRKVRPKRALGDKAVRELKKQVARVK